MNSVWGLGILPTKVGFSVGVPLLDDAWWPSPMSNDHFPLRSTALGAPVYANDQPEAKCTSTLSWLWWDSKKPHVINQTKSGLLALPLCWCIITFKWLMIRLQVGGYIVGAFPMLTFIYALVSFKYFLGMFLQRVLSSAKRRCVDWWFIHLYTVFCRCVHQPNQQPGSYSAGWNDPIFFWLLVCSWAATTSTNQHVNRDPHIRRVSFRSW